MQLLRILRELSRLLGLRLFRHRLLVRNQKLPQQRRLLLWMQHCEPNQCKLLRFGKLSVFFLHLDPEHRSDHWYCSGRWVSSAHYGGHPHRPLRAVQQEAGGEQEGA